MMQQQPKLSRAEVEQLLERVKAVPSISFGYIRMAQDCLAYMDALDEVRSEHSVNAYGPDWCQLYERVVRKHNCPVCDLDEAILPAASEEADMTEEPAVEGLAHTHMVDCPCIAACKACEWFGCHTHKYDGHDLRDVRSIIAALRQAQQHAEEKAEKLAGEWAVLPASEEHD